MRHPVKSDFGTSVTEAGVTVTFKPTNSIYSFYRLADTDDIARVGSVSLALADTRGQAAILRTTPLMRFGTWHNES